MVPMLRFSNDSPRRNPTSRPVVSACPADPRLPRVRRVGPFVRAHGGSILLFNGFGDVESNQATRGSRLFTGECGNEKTDLAGRKAKNCLRPARLLMSSDRARVGLSHFRE